MDPIAAGMQPQAARLTLQQQLANVKKNTTYPLSPYSREEFELHTQSLEVVRQVVEMLRANPNRTDLQTIGPHEHRILGGGTSLHWAVKMEDTTMVVEILAADIVDFNARDRLWEATALHYAVRLGNIDIVKLMLTKHLELGKLDVNAVDCWGYMALHWAIISGSKENIDMVRELLTCKDTMRLSEESHKDGETPLQIAHEKGYRDIQRTLMEHEVVRRYVEELYRDRQVYVDAANAILVGAALIASVTFGSWLQPPLGLTPDHVDVQHNTGLGAFWIFNSFSFYFAIATVVFGARSVLPRNVYFIKRTVEKLRKNLLITAVLLACSVFFVIIAFGIAGCIVLTPILKYRWYMIVPTIIGGLVCLISLGYLSWSMWEDSFGKSSVARRKYKWSGFEKWRYE